MNEPKSAKEHLIEVLHEFNTRSDGSVESLVALFGQKIADVVDDPVIAEWKRKADALDKLEKMADGTPKGYIHIDRTDQGNICLIIDPLTDDNSGVEVFAPTLLAAIEQAAEQDKP